MFWAILPRVAETMHSSSTNSATRSPAVFTGIMGSPSPSFSMRRFSI